MPLCDKHPTYRALHRPTADCRVCKAWYDALPRPDGWSAKDLTEFDQMVTMTDSIRQMDRIKGRFKWREFEKRFTKTQLDSMWARIK